MRGLGSIPIGGNISRSKASDGNIGIIAILVHFEKISCGILLSLQELTGIKQRKKVRLDGRVPPPLRNPGSTTHVVVT